MYIVVYKKTVYDVRIEHTREPYIQLLLKVLYHRT